MQNDLIVICDSFSKIVNISVETVWFFRQQYFFKGYASLNQLICLLESNLQMIATVAGNDIVENLGIKELLEAQEKKDEILIADILEAQIIPCLEDLVQQIEQQVEIDERDYLEENLKVLELVDNCELAEQIRAAKEYDNCEYIPEYTANGQITIRLLDCEKEYYVSGNNNPYKDAISFVHGNMEEKIYKYVLFGVGLMYEAEVLLNHRPDAQIVVVEEDPFLLRMALKYRKMSDILSDERILLVCCTFGEYIRKNNLDDRCLWIRKPAMNHCKKSDSRMALERFFLKSMTIREQAFALEQQFRKNIGLKDNIHSVDECKESFSGKTVYLVAGGPSLDNTIDVLRMREEDSLIVCVGTSAAKLKNAGIIPDFVIITDTAEAIFHQIHENLDKDKTILLYMISANAKAVESFEGRKYAIFQKGFDLAESYAKEHGYTLVNTGGSVSTTALDICIQFGCKKVICLGLDLAYTYSRTHAFGTRGVKNVSLDSNELTIRGVLGNEIPTSMNLLTYHSWIEERIRNEKSISFVNISDGAYIQGMQNFNTKKVNDELKKNRG